MAVVPLLKNWIALTINCAGHCHHGVNANDIGRKLLQVIEKVK